MYDRSTILKFMKDRTIKINEELEKLVKNCEQYGEACGLDSDEMDEEVQVIRKFQKDWNYKMACLGQFDIGHWDSQIEMD